jgi:hypothetical protein
VKVPILARPWHSILTAERVDSDDAFNAA